MCFCGTPTVNGQPSKDPWRVNPPELKDSDTLLFDEPGRCGGIDSHAYHFRVVANSPGGRWCDLLVRHGGGDERMRISNAPAVVNGLESMDSNGRYWMLHAIYHAHSDAFRLGRDLEAQSWRQAAAEKRIKVRKVRGQSAVRVSVEPRPMQRREA